MNRHRLVSSVIAIGAVVMVAVMCAGCIDLPSRQRPKIPEGIPPGAGVTQPALDLADRAGSDAALRAWAQPVAQDTAIGQRALIAYGRAAETQRQRNPGCRLAWTTLAGIGGVESRHGTYHGASISAVGDVRPRIRGVELDGTGGNRTIPNSRTDPHTTGEYARAMGPFQFLPETWARFGADGNGDGRADPDNIDDAALGAARYLCISGGDLGTPAGWQKAVLVYNNSTTYVLDVRDHANAYSIGVAY